MPENQPQAMSWGKAIMTFVGMGIAGAIAMAIGGPILGGLISKLLFAGAGMMLASPLLSSLKNAIGSAARSIGSSSNKSTPPTEDASLENSRKLARAQTRQIPESQELLSLRKEVETLRKSLEQSNQRTEQIIKAFSARPDPALTPPNHQQRPPAPPLSPRAEPLRDLSTLLPPEGLQRGRPNPLFAEDEAVREQFFRNLELATRRRPGAPRTRLLDDELAGQRGPLIDIDDGHTLQPGRERENGQRQVPARPSSVISRR